MLTQMLFTVMAPIAVIYAALRGGAPEKIAAGVFLAAAAATGLVDHGFPTEAGSVRWGVFAIDCIAFIAFCAVALRANRIWPLWLTALQLLTVLAHVVNILNQNPRPWAYAASIIVSGVLMVPLLILATYRHRRRLRLTGVDESWSN